MDDATQKLVDEVIRRTPMRITDEGIVMQASEIEAMIADALEAAQRPTVSGEYTHVVNLARASEAADKGLDALIDYLADLPTVEEWRPPVSPEQREALQAELDRHEYDGSNLCACGESMGGSSDGVTWTIETNAHLTDAILARFSIPERPPVSGSVELICDVCGSAYPVWFAPDEVWNLGGSERPGMECPSCFAETFEAHAGETVVWEFRPERARFSLPVLDAEKVARWLYGRDRSYSTFGEALDDATALVASLHTLTTDGTPADTERNES